MDYRDVVNKTGPSFTHAQTGAEAGAPVNIRNVQVKDSVRPNNRIPLTFTVRNSKGSSVPFLDPDNCTSSTLGQGTRVSVNVDIGGDVVTDQRCITIDGGEQELSFSGYAPDNPGSTVNVSITLKGANSGNVFDTFDTAVSISEDSSGGSCPTGFVHDPESGGCVPAGDEGGSGGWWEPGDEENGGGNPLQLAMENPGKAAGLLIAGSFAINSIIPE